MSNHDNAEMRDELARLLGWHISELNGCWTNADGNVLCDETGSPHGHPCENSLDSLAAIWKEHLAGWEWIRAHTGGTEGNELMEWSAANLDGSATVEVPDTNNLLHDALSLTLAVMRVEKGEKA